MLERLFALEVFGIKLGLDNIRQLCAALDHPERAFATVHVAGTNGKGSVTAVVHAALVAAGVHSGRYTSPHLSRLNERFMIGRSDVEDAVLDAAAARILDTADRLRRAGAMAAPPTFFEATTAIAFELFRGAGVSAAVVEVGLGGRFDATNVIDPAVGAITSIALDHQAQLGDTVERIAFEKAGIIKPGMTVVTGPLPAAAAAVVRRVADERGATLVESTAGVRLVHDARDGRARLTLRTPDGQYGPLRLALRGEHQVQNAVVAVRVLESARRAGIDVSDAAVIEGLETVEWPARLELLARADGGRVLLDAAHNPEGAGALAAYLARWHPDRPPLVVGIMRDKDVDAILGALLPVTSTVLTAAADTPRAMTAAEVAARVTAIDPTRVVRPYRDVGAALDAACAEAETVCVAGSIFLVGAARDHLERRGKLH